MPADPPVIFHAGFHKTGTSSLQAALRLHGPALDPLFAVQTRATCPALLAAADAARDFSADPTPQSATRMASHIDLWASGLTLRAGQGLLVSCEDFAGHIPGRFGVPDYRAALPIATALRSALRRHLPGRPLTFLFTSREPHSWLRSIHWQLSKHDELTLGPRRFARAYAAAADFAPLLSSLRAALPDTPLHEADLASLAPRRLGPVEAIYDAACLPDDLRACLPVPPHANATPPHDLARVFVKLNRSDLPRPEIRRLKREMLAAETLFLGPPALAAPAQADSSR